MAKRQCLSIKELAVTGTDLIADGMQPGKAIGETLKQLWSMCWNTRRTTRKKINGTGS